MGRILKGHPVNLRVPVIIVIGIGAYQTVMPDGYFPSRTTTRPTLQMLERCPLAVSKSMAAKSFMS